MEEDVAEVRRATDFVEIASEHLALKKVGRRWVGLCPFHAEKSPSFSLNAEEGLYYCFGCQAKGDVITFVREVEHLDFVDAVERLAGRAGIQLRHDNADVNQNRLNRKKLTDALEQAVEWYHQRLMNGDDAKGARSYLRGRGYDSELVKQFRLGWAPDERDALSRALNLSNEVLRDTGLGFLNRRNRQQDAFHNRVMFPIFDVAGRPVAFGGRILNLDGAHKKEEIGPKYKNSPETKVYSKRRTLYGLNWAKAAIVERGEVVVCEGYTDVIGLFQSGIPMAVATCGTSLADEHFGMLKNFARRVVLAYDADAAGQAAAQRFYEWEKRFDIDIAVAVLPSGSDPGELAQRNPEALRSAVERAMPFLSFRVDRVLAEGDLSTAEGRARTATTAIGVIAEHPNTLVRDQYVMQVADRCRVDPERLRDMTGKVKPISAPVPVRLPGDPGSTSKGGPELEALRFAVHHPEEVSNYLEDVLFADELYLAAFRALASSRTLHEAIERADPNAATLLQRLAVEESYGDAMDVVARLIDRAAQRALVELEAEGRAGEVGFEELASTTSWLKRAIEELREPATAREVASRLVIWLTSRNKEGA